MTVAILTFILCVKAAPAQFSFSKPFEDCGVTGSITIYDYNSKKWVTSDVHDSQFPTLPASTFKIINTLIVLETGIVTDENELVKWPGRPDTVKYGYRPDIYRDMSLKEAFKLSAVWAFVELAKKVGKDHYLEYLDKLSYGNADLSVNDIDFWNFGRLAISPVNQIELLKGIYEETLPFSGRSFRILKAIMIEEQKEGFTLRGKTGWTSDRGEHIGWWVGYVERTDNVYFFATRLRKDRDESNPAFGKCRKEITKTLLAQLNILD